MHDLNAIPILIEVAECLSFTQAAKKLHMTKSAVSKSISTVESHLGVKLFNRSTRHISLTEIGTTYIEYLKASYSFIEQGNDAIAQLNIKAAGRIKISAPMSFGTLHLSKIIAEFLKLYPDLQTELILDDSVVDLVAEGFDVAIRIGHLPDSSLIGKKITPCYSALCASPDYLSLHKQPKTVTDLKEHNCLFYSLYQSGQEWVFYKDNQAEHISPTGNLIVNNSESLLQATVQGVGISLLPCFIAAPYIEKGMLTPLLTDYSLPEHSIYAVYPNRHYLPHKTRMAIDFLFERLNPKSEYGQRYEINYYASR
ncbi:TPA: LysR family transcriptional regulator [Providencia stuartii]|uniref:LysR family transcriptional regulator n=1 Tax=Providencia stuartii (strain MRSN 2154) TaxID=1157951 RepID=A0A140NSH3_PROSM|nr:MULTISPECIES: LysR family transcriptional regulator [Providencia]AFH95610.1 LysR family transcriptional regulator [Providencia stuartii MRSN 2154]MBN5561164.1 LysR family transcriptional regulator [Providencia stuartii]MBN5600849.1 LysR family transcriptional regulator [Providencia stuartii]MBN5604580.1 LysR family transcriptional regulator [Providencia stuartii]MCL8326873.1 LysR family transcriptional regulator [Providencia thailandensis]